MRWVRISSEIADDIRVLAIPSNRRRFECVGLLTLVAGYCFENLTDGCVPSGVPSRLHASEEAVAELERVGLLIKRQSGGWVFGPGVIGS